MRPSTTACSPPALVGGGPVGVVCRTDVYFVLWAGGRVSRQVGGPPTLPPTGGWDAGTFRLVANR